ncbi:hypothetical protein [Streptococcus suis]|uniref:Phage protein n=1 Tax=Streptococcus suis TaxID=1307 RepID=M1VDU2_STRSU|nr:hypothetical protein [Streptococcus suis]MCK3935092.1 hypothetical protein [Streptococcus suis]NQG29040.1 hypothetical protein [Streptococcus suis]CYW31055.1 phage protein [Streptococcus suis]BAM94965.1 hypothetical protein [Streptococcus suis]HEL1640967.1 hypothetical protein [Streptococcus suis]
MKLTAISLSEFYQSIEEHVKNQAVEATSPKTIRKKARAIFSGVVSQMISFGKNLDMQDYLKDTALSMELSHRSKNFIVVDEDNFYVTGEWLGLITLSLKVVDISDIDEQSKKKMVMAGKSIHNIQHIPGILIAQLGKNMLLNNSVQGSDLLKLALEMIVSVQNTIGGKMVFLDSVNHPKIISLYESFGFVKYGELIQDKHRIGVVYQPMALDLTKRDMID